jgi:protein-S-isoprenylcysteine O-methyltransferase Ste14
MKRLFFLLYGLCAYAIFLATFLYVIGWLADLLVPKGISSGTPGALWPSILTNSGLLGLFAVQHNLMARPWFKARWTKIVPAPIERSTFVLATCAVIAAMVHFWQPLPDVIWDLRGSLGGGLLWGGYALGFGIVLVSTFLIDHFELFGLSQVVRAFRRRPSPEVAFQVKSLYRFVRHPLMVGFVIAFWSAPLMTGGRLLFAAVTSVWILIALQLEERDLVAVHGDAYREYQRSTPMLLPRLSPGAAVAPARQGSTVA